MVHATAGRRGRGLCRPRELCDGGAGECREYDEHGEAPTVGAQLTQHPWYLKLPLTTARLADRLSGVVTVAQARSLALALPEAVEQDHHGRPSFRVGGKIFATLWDEEHMNVMCDADGVRTAVQAEPSMCAEQWWGKRLAAVRVSLPDADAGVLAELLADAWERKAPKRLLDQR